MLVLKVLVTSLKPGDRIYMHYQFPKVEEISQVDGQIRVDLVTDDSKKLVRFYGLDRKIVIRR